MTALMQGKRGLIMGLANDRSLAWGIAKACRAQGAEVAFTYQGDALKKRVEPPPITHHSVRRVARCRHELAPDAPRSPWRPRVDVALHVAPVTGPS